MIKLVCAIALLLFTTVAFLFSRKKQTQSCTNTISGTIKELKDSSGVKLYIEGPDNMVYYPRIEKENLILTSGSKVKICFDPIEKLSGNISFVKINDVVYLP